MNTNERQNNEFADILKSNYKQRFEEVENFSRELSKTSADFHSQYLLGLSNLFEHYIDLQKKFTKSFTPWYDLDLMRRQSMMITQSLINTMHIMRSFYNSLLDYQTKNTRVFNQVMTQILQMTEMHHDMSENMSPIQKNTLIEIIKQTNEYNNNFGQNQILAKKSLPEGKTQKKHAFAKKVSS